MTTIALMVCLLCVCSWITVPSVIPFTMQTFAVFCALLLLGGKDGTIAVAFYIILGCVGLPVFSGFQGGIGVLLGPTGGFIIGFVFASLCYLLLEPLILKKEILRIPVLSLGIILCYVIGALWFRTVSGLHGTAYSIRKILIICILPYILPDAAKLFLSLLICKKIRKAAGSLIHSTAAGSPDD